MGIPGSANLLLAAAEAESYQIEQSLRFGGGQFIGRANPASTATSRQTFTHSFWVKRGALGSTQQLAYWVQGGTAQQTFIAFDSSDRINVFYEGSAGASVGHSYSTARYRDPSAWYHIVWATDTTQATSTNRWKLWVNGEQVTTWDSVAYPSQNLILPPNDASGGRGFAHGARYGNEDQLLSGYMAESYFVDGQFLDQDDFGEYDDNGVWRPVSYSGTYGARGWYLPFVATDIYSDESGNNQDFAARGDSYDHTTSGTGTDVMSDTPTNNYATMNSVATRPSYVPTFSEGNLKVTHRSGTGQYSHCGSTFAFKSDDSSGFYCEVLNGAQSYGGVSLIVTDYGVHNLHPDVSNGFSTNTNGGIGYDSNGYIRHFGTTIDYTSSASYNGGSDILGIAVKDNKVWFSINGTWIASGNPSTGANPVITLSSTQTFVVGSYGQGSRVFVNNFGQRDFSYTVPTGFKAMNTSNLPAPDIADGSKYFNTVLYTGNGSNSHAITGVGFQPSLVWGKCRNVGTDHYLVDAVRGVTKVLRSNVSNAEYTQTDGLVSFDSDGFTLDDDNSGGPSGNFNINARTYVAWNWLAGGSGSSNTAGSITSTVSASPSSGFSVVTWLGNATNGSVGHGLGVAPKFLIVKDTTNGYNWYVFTTATGSNLRFEGLNTTSAATTQASQFTASSTVISNLTTSASLNTNGATMLMYCFAEVEGYSKFGKYQGNSNNDGAFVYTGFKPAWLLIKRYNVSGAWFLMDSARNTYNVVDDFLYPNTSGVEDSGSFSEAVDLLSNGFKCRTTSGYLNGTGDSYIFVAFASSPFGGSGVSPATAR